MLWAIRIPGPQVNVSDCRVFTEDKYWGILIPRLNQAALLCGVGSDESLELFGDKSISCPHKILDETNTLS